jgi:hypothetical protein
MIPSSIKSAIDAHAELGHRCGDFVQAVLENNFREAVVRADRESYKALREIAQYVYCSLPSDSHGSQEKVKYWRDRFKYDDVVSRDAAALARSCRECTTQADDGGDPCTTDSPSSTSPTKSRT